MSEIQELIGNLDMNPPDSQFTLKIHPQDWVLEGDASLSLVEVAILSGVELPTSCRNGTCRTCICRLVDGEIEYRIEWPGLSIEEKQEGLILPCVAEMRSDVCIDAPLAKRVFQRENE